MTFTKATLVCFILRGPGNNVRAAREMCDGQRVLRGHLHHASGGEGGRSALRRGILLLGVRPRFADFGGGGMSIWA